MVRLARLRSSLSRLRHLRREHLVCAWRHVLIRSRVRRSRVHLAANEGEKVSSQLTAAASYIKLYYP
eukprot:scaffold45393_cov60-Phaeocystis_antarctica.AAC.4